jgi:DNA modification methylase
MTLTNTAPELTADIYNEDCITGMNRLPDNSIDLTVTSIPFEELFTYSGKLEDVGNNGSTIDIREGRFAANLRFVFWQLLRVTKPGCNVCIHIQQLLAYKVQHGFQGRRDFRGAVIDLARATGFDYYGEVAIPKDPQAMAQRQNLHCLQFKTAYERGGQMLAPAPNDFLLIFKKPGEIDPEVVCRPMIAKTNPGGWITGEDWILWARGVWEIDAFDILDGARSAKESDEEKHVCPLQLELIRRCILLYTNPASKQSNVTVLDPFMGIGSTAAVSLECGRNVIGFELKESYFQNAIKNVARTRARMARAGDEGATLYDMLSANEAPAVGGAA